MGDVTIGLATERGGHASGAEQSVVSSQAADPTNSLGLAMMDPVRATKFKEDLFTKSNLEYAQRLKEHLYQFENRVNETGMDEALHGDAGTMMQIS